MKKRIINLLKRHNSEKQGLHIQAELDYYVEKLGNYATIHTHLIDDRLVGFIAYYKNDENKELAYLSMLIVDEEFQFKGIGSSLMKSFLTDVINEGFKIIKLEVLKSNEKAINFYEKLDFKIIGNNGKLYIMEKCI